MEIQQYVDKIKQEKWDFSYKEAKVFDDGRGHQWIQFDLQNIFRFSRKGESLKKEHLLLRYLDNTFDCRIPKSLYLSKDESWQEESFITGTKLREIPRDNSFEILTEIALFLKQLHSLPRKELAEIWYTRDDDNSWYVRHMKEKVITHLSEHIDTKLQDDIFVFVERAFWYVHPNPCLIHGDMNGKNIFWDESLAWKTRLGIIDFDDATIFDPAKDFCHFWHQYGKENLQKMLRVYGEVDDWFIDRIEMHYKRARLYVCIDHIVKDRKRSIEEVVVELEELYWRR